MTLRKAKELFLAGKVEGMNVKVVVRKDYADGEYLVDFRTCLTKNFNRAAMIMRSIALTELPHELNNLIG